jgi:glycosyltransferase involved in cell wall biosynthesis
VSVLEALAAGLPVVASRVSGLPVHFGDAVRFADPGSAAALADALTAVVDDPELRAELARRGRTVVHERFDPSVMVDRYLRLYADLAGPAEQSLDTSGAVR